MDKNRIKKIIIAIMLVISGSQQTLAQGETVTTQTTTSATPASISAALAEQQHPSTTTTTTTSSNKPSQAMAPGQSLDQSSQTQSTQQSSSQAQSSSVLTPTQPQAQMQNPPVQNSQAPGRATIPMSMNPGSNLYAPTGSAMGQSMQNTTERAIEMAPPENNPQENYHNYRTRGAPVISPPLTFEQSQQAMLNSAPPVSIAQPADANAAFNALMQQNLPLSPQQVVRLRQLIDVSQRAAAIPATIPPKPVSTTLMINLAPGTTPPAIRLAQGYVSSLVFVDSTGSPWPIAAYDIGDPKTANIQWDAKSNIMLIQATSPYSDSDIVVRLTGLMTPITLELVSGQRVVDYRTDIHVSGLGPNSKDIPTGSALPASANQLLLSVLDGIAPPGSKNLTVKGGDCQAWLLGDTMYLRTRLTVLSPGWVGRMVSPDGMYAYEIQKSSSVLVSQYGEPIELKIGGF